MGEAMECVDVEKVRKQWFDRYTSIESSGFGGPETGVGEAAKATLGAALMVVAGAVLLGSCLFVVLPWAIVCAGLRLVRWKKFHLVEERVDAQ